MPLNEAVAHEPVVEVGGRPLPPGARALLEVVVVDDSLHVPDLAELRFRDSGGTVLVDAGISIGSVLRIGLSTHNAQERAHLLTVEVTALEYEADVHGAHVVVRGLDRSHRLLAGRRVAAYVDMSAGDVVRTVAQRAGVKVGRVDATGEVHEHLTQDGVSDWEFLRRLALESGRELRVVEEGLDFVDPTPAREAPSRGRRPEAEPLALAQGKNLEQVRVVVAATGLVGEVEVRGWDPMTKREVVGTAPAEATGAQLEGTTPADLARGHGAPRLVQTMSSYRTQGQCRTLAKALAARVSGGFAEVEGRARGNARLRAGKPVVLSGAGPRFDGKYTLTSTRHEWDPERGYVTWFTASGASERSLWRAAQPAAPAPAVSGPVTAVVSDNKDPEGLGRVRVTFPVLSDDYTSTWARVVSGGGGSGRGAALVPEVNDEVLVLFGMGRMDDPFVVGGLHNGKDKPGDGEQAAVHGTTGEVQRRSFTSRTGMVVEMVEADGQARLTVSNAGGAQRLSLVEKPDKKIELFSEGELEVTAKKAVNVTTGTGDVTVKTSGGKLTLAGSEIAVEATGALTLKGATVSVKGSASAELGAPVVKVAGDATAELSASGKTTVRGGMVTIN